MGVLLELYIILVSGCNRIRQRFFGGDNKSHREGASLVVAIFFCIHDKWCARFSLLCVAVSDKFLKAVAGSALGTLGGKGNVALCLESLMRPHASQHVSSHPDPFYPSPISPSCLPPLTSSQSVWTKPPPGPQQDQCIDSGQCHCKKPDSVFSTVSAQVLFMCTFFRILFHVGGSVLWLISRHTPLKLRSEGGVLNCCIYLTDWLLLNGNSD